jgi:hypothetical protein
MRTFVSMFLRSKRKAAYVATVVLVILAGSRWLSVDQARQLGRRLGLRGFSNEEQSRTQARQWRGGEKRGDDAGRSHG